MNIEISGPEPAEQLTAKLDMLSNRSLDESTSQYFSLELLSVRITPKVLSALVQILHHPLPRTQNGKDSKWEMVWFQKCRLARACMPHNADLLHALMAALATRTKHLTLLNSPEIVACLARDPKLDQLEVNSLSISEGMLGSIVEYVKLGDMIQKSAHLNKLHLQLDFDEVPGKMLESLANATSIKDLELHQRRADAVVGECGSGNLMVRLLQNPQGPLRHLTLSFLGLEDSHFIAIAQLLPTSQLKVLDVSNNKIQPQGILEFAKQLPRIKSLRKIVLQNNPWVSDVRYFSQREECCLALVQGMIENYSVEDLDLGRYDDSIIYILLDKLKGFPQGALLTHFIDLNRAGRRILPASTFIPSGLWPFVLKRAGTPTLYPSEWCIGEDQRARSVNAVYSLLQSCPIFAIERGVSPID